MRLALRTLLLSTLLLGLPACRETPAQPKSEGPPAWAGPTTVRPPSAGRLDRSHRGSPAPAAPFEDPDGDSASLADFLGKPLLVNLWATWCAPCVAEMPTLDALAVREEGNLQILALSQDLEGRTKVDGFFAERGFTMLEPYIDPQLAMMAELKVDTLPTTILFDAQGREMWRMTGIEDWESERAARLIGEAAPSRAAVR